MEEDAPKPVLSEEQLHTLFKTENNWIDYARAIERAVLEAVGGQKHSNEVLRVGDTDTREDLFRKYVLLNNHCAAVEMEATALRAFHDRAIEILGAHGALDQGVEVDALTWLADVLAQADQLRASNVNKATERAQLIAMVQSHRDWEQSCGLTSGGKLLSAPTTLIVDVLDAVLRALRELERDVDERSREIGEVMRVNERLAKERDVARRELEKARAIMADAGASSRLSDVCPSPAVCQQGCADLRADAELWRFFRANLGTYYREPPMNAATGRVVADEDWFWQVTIRLPNRALFDEAMRDALDRAREGE